MSTYWEQQALKRPDRCTCGHSTDRPDGLCAPCAAMENCYQVFCNIFETFPNKFEIVQQLMRWPWTLHAALDVWAHAEDATEQGETQ